jgi:cytochrome c biogenesis protein ResB
MAMYGELIDQGAPRTLEEMRSFREKMGIRVRSAERDAATERFRELEKLGLSQPDIHQALIQEGYITRPEVKR